MDRRKRILRNDKGFTLAELMVVVVIIGLLAGIVLPKIFGHLGTAKENTAKSQIESIGAALDSFRLDIGRYPTTQEGLQALQTNPGLDKWKGPYLKKEKIPKDPWDKDYVYQSPGTHGDYDMMSYGRDGSPGGEGEDKDIVSWE